MEILLKVKRVKRFYLRRNCTRWFAFLIGVVIIKLLYMLPVIDPVRGWKKPAGNAVYVLKFPPQLA
jgi:hypothetical protein